MAFLVTGGCGFVGSNLVADLLLEGAKVVVFDNLSREGSLANLQWLRKQGKFTFVHGDVRIGSDIESLMKRDDFECIFHLAGQVAMTTSLSSPRRDFEVNVLGSINILELARNYAPHATIVYASSNKVYGGLDEIKLHETGSRYEPINDPKAIDESARLDFRTPYGCSKGAADQYMLEYARNFGLRTVVFRHSTIYGGRQASTVDQGWVGWFCYQALETKSDSSHSFTISGDGKQVRDLLYVSDAVRCYRSAHLHIDKAAGQAFNIGGGPENSMSLLELFEHLEHLLGVKLHFKRLPWRNNDQRFFVANNGKAEQLIGWLPTVSKIDGVQATLDWESRRASS